MTEPSAQPEVRFFFGAMSPYSWFAAERIATVLPHAAWQPVLAGAIFKAHGRTSWGLTTQRAERLADCERRATAHGLGPICWPDPWPTTDLLIARAMTYAHQLGRLHPFAMHAMRDCFQKGHDLADPASIGRAADAAGLDPDEVLAATADPLIKQVLRQTTDHALDLGVFGVPTVTVGRTLHWGDDQLEAAARDAQRCPLPPTPRGKLDGPHQCATVAWR